MFEGIFALLLFLVPLAYSPGPGNLFFAAIGARFGTRASWRASAGYHLATWIVTFAVGFGFLEILQRFPAVFTGMQLAGGIYMLWLALTFFCAGRHDGNGEAVRAGFWDGAVLLVLNPKAYVIIALMFTQFLHDDDRGFLVLLLVITTVFTLNNMIAFLVWTMMGDALGRMFRSVTQARVLNWIFGAMLGGVAVWMLLAKV